MSELNKQSLTSIGTNKIDKKCKTAKKTVRISVTLYESNEEACPELSYRDLLISAEKKRKILQRRKESTDLNGFNQSASAEDEAIVRRLEAKYGDGGSKKLGRMEDFADLGAGYDETDPFIDNTDAFDEVLPDKMTTAHGGFYINSGALEFKGLSDHSDADEPMGKVKRRVKRVLSLADDDDDDDDDEQEEKEKEVSKEDEMKSNGIIHISKRSKTDVVGDKEDILKKRKLSQDRELLKKKKKRAIDDLIKKKSATVKDLLKEKRETLELSTSVASPEPNDITVLPTTNTSVIDIIESVAIGAEIEDLSVDSMTLEVKSQAGSLLNSDTDDSQLETEKERKEDAQLPDNLPDDMKEMIAILEKAAKNSAEGKHKFFSPDINKILLRLEQRCSIVQSQTRILVYTHLAFYLPCTKDTLMKRAKKLHLKYEEEKLNEPMSKLKAAVSQMMPLVLENYTKESQQAVEENPQLYWELYRYYWSTEDSPMEVESKPGTLESKIPRKKFPWSKELRSTLWLIVQAKTRCLEVIYSRKETVDKNLHSFLEKDVKIFWPPGWMTVPKLLAECENKNVDLQYKPKKHRLVPKKVPLVFTQASSGLVTTPASVPPASNVPSRSVSSAPALALNGAKVVSFDSSTAMPTTIMKPAKETAIQLNPSVITKSPPKTFDKVFKSANHSKITSHSDDKLVPKTLDLSNGVNRTTTVIVPTSPVNNEISITNQQLKPSPPSQLPMSMLKIPDCISVSPASTTPVLPKPIPSVNTAPLSLPTSPMTPPNRMLSLKQQIRNASDRKLTVPSTEEVMDLMKDANKLLMHTDNDIVVKLPKRAKKPKRPIETLELPSVPVVEPKIQKTLTSPISEKEETDRATNFISQIIEESFATSRISASNDSHATGYLTEMNHYASQSSQLKEIKKHHSLIAEDKIVGKIKKDEVKKTPAAVDIVQEECERVANILGAMSSFKTEPVVDIMATTPVIVPTNVVKPLGLSSTHNPHMKRRSPGGSNIVGFQDAFQKHLFQSIPEIDISTLPEMNNVPPSYVQIKEPPISSDISPSRHSNSFKLPGSYVQPSVNIMESTHSYGGRTSSTANSHFQEPIHSPHAAGLLQNGLQFNPNTDDPFTLTPVINYGNTFTGSSRPSPSS